MSVEDDLELPKIASGVRGFCGGACCMTMTSVVGSGIVAREEEDVGGISWKGNLLLSKTTCLDVMTHRVARSKQR